MLEFIFDSFVEDYLVIVEMRGEFESWKICIWVYMGKWYFMCVVNDFESGMVYSVKVVVCNKMGYSEFVEKEV